MAGAASDAQSALDRGDAALWNEGTVKGMHRGEVVRVKSKLLVCANHSSAVIRSANENRL